MTYETAKAKSIELNSRVNVTCKALRSIEGVGSGPTGLTSATVRKSKQYREAKAAFDAAFKELRAFNGVYVKTYRKEIKEERCAR